MSINISNIGGVIVDGQLDLNKVIDWFKQLPSIPRSEFTESIASQFVALGYNVFVCHPAHHITGGPVDHIHYDLKDTFSVTGYDIYFIKKGIKVVATNYGDGGFENWAYGGSFQRDGKTITFH